MNFLDDNFLLSSPLAVSLFHDYAKSMPIIDYHSHLDASLISTDAKCNTITKLWLEHDHYKWRLMRCFDIDESLISGDGDDYQKFLAFCSCMPSLIGNPIYVWCHLELKRYFGYEGVINSDSAKQIYELCNQKLKTADYSVRALIRRSNVELICTTDDPLDDLAHHKTINESKDSFCVLPTFRPDKAINISSPLFCDYICKLTNGKNDLASIKNALSARLDFFIKSGCKITDHGLEGFIFADCTDDEAENILNAALSGKKISQTDSEKYQTHILLFLSRLYAKHNLCMQLHFNCLRNNSTRLMNCKGVDSGGDSINSSQNPVKLSKFLDALDKNGELAKTIIYSLDASDNALINSILGCFQSGKKGKLQHGSAWWFNDTRQGMLNQIETLAQTGALGNFVGMLTDSRSFVSFTRHEYFRRILCNFIASQVNIGEYPSDPAALKTLVQNICYYNIKSFLN